MKTGSKHSRLAKLKMQVAVYKHTPNFLGKHHTPEAIKKIKEARARQIHPRLGKKLSIEIRMEMSQRNKGKHYSKRTEFKKGQRPWNYGMRGIRKVKPPFYTQIHSWLKSKFGRASRCQNMVCEKKSKNYQWAKLKQYPYEFKKEYFVELCIPCHQKYDKGVDVWIVK